MIQHNPHDLEKLRFIDTADVYKAETKAGTLRRDDDGSVQFSYLPDYAGEPLSLTLPMGENTRTFGGALPPFFAGLLPEGHRLSVLVRATKTSLDDELTMLLAVGADTPGDVRIVPHGDAPAKVVPLVEDPSQWDFSELTDAVDRFALPGVQNKASASMINAPIATPHGFAILKIDPPQYPHLVRNEHSHLLVAHQLHIPVAQSRIVTDSTGREGLLVTRFDRSLDARGEVVRIAQEDASQVLGISPSRKYSVDSEAVVKALAERTQAPPVAARNLYLQFLFAWLTGNGDLHAKNVSIIRGKNGRWDIAPIYDIPCTAVYRDFTMALPVAGRTSTIRGRHWDEFAGAIGIPPKAARAAQQLALRAASKINLAAMGFEGSVLRGAERELHGRRLELASLAS